MTIDASWYDKRTQVLHVSCQTVPRAIVLTRPDRRGRDVYTARSYRYERCDGRRRG